MQRTEPGMGSRPNCVSISSTIKKDKKTRTSPIFFFVDFPSIGLVAYPSLSSACQFIDAAQNSWYI